MNEETLFAAALEKQDPAERRAFLDQACAGDPALRQQVEELLLSNDEAGVFLNVPAVQLAAAADAPEHDQTEGAATSTPQPVSDQLGETQAESAQAEKENDVLALLAPPREPGSLGRLDHYEVLAVVGSGGMGVVLKARDTSLQRVVAIKLLAPQLAASGTARKRFVREARAAAAVRDAHIVDIHAVQEAGPIPYLVMEYIDGATLEERIKQRGPVELKEVLRIGMQMAEGLAAAHKQGLIHRDIKPANILLENGVERVKITDFGLARTVDDASLTQSGMIAGTPMFMSPEQAGGQDIDQRSDLFSLGSVLYAMCTGRAPFRAKTAVAVLKRVCEDTPRPIRESNPEIPEWLAAVVARLHAKRPEERFQSAAEVAELLTHRLSELRTGGEVAAPQWSEQPRESVEHSPAVPPTCSRGRARMVAAVVLIPISTLLAIGAGMVVWLVWFPPWAMPLERRLLGTWEGSGMVWPEVGRGLDWAEATETDWVEFKPDGTYSWDQNLKLQGREFSEHSGWPEKGRPPPRWEVIRAEGNMLAVRIQFGEVVFNFQGENTFTMNFSWPGEHGTVTFHRSGTPSSGASSTRPAVNADPVGKNNPDRQAAEYVLSIGGAARVNDIERSLQVAIDQQREPFRLTQVFLHENQQVTDAGLANFKDCKNLTQLGLQDTPVSDAGLAFFQNCTKLTSLQLHNTKVSDAGLALFKDCKALTSLGLENTLVSDAGMAPFKDCKTLTSLDLIGTKVTAAMIDELKKALPRCRIDWNGGVFLGTVILDPDRQAAAWVLARGGYVTIDDGQRRDVRQANELPAGPWMLLGINLWQDKQMDDTGLKEIAGLENLQNLHLGGTKITDTGLKELASLKNLGGVCLDGTGVTDAGMKELAGFPNLRRIYAGGAPITDAGLKELAQKENLQELELFQTAITDAGLKELAGLRAIRVLLLMRTPLTDAGLMHLRGLTTLRRLDLTGTKATAEGIAALQTALPRCKITWDGGVIEPSGLDIDRRAAEYMLSIGGTVRVDDPERYLTAAADLPHEPFRLTGVELRTGTQVSDAGLAAISGCKDLKSLSLEHTQLTDAGLAPFKGCTDLTGLCLGGTQVGDVGLANFKDCKELEWLDLNWTQVSDAGLALFKDCKGMRRLCLDRTHVSDAGLAQFKDCKKLERLTLEGTQVGDAGLVHFKDCKHLTHLNVSHTQITDAGLDYFKDCKNLTYLNLQKTKVTAAEIDELKKALPQCKIEWDGGVIEPTVVLDPDRRAAEYVLSIGGAVQVNDGESELKSAADLPREPFRLSAVHLTNNQQVSDAGLASFKDCKNLTHLDVSYTRITDAGLDYFKDCKNLTYLGLGHTQITDAGLDYFKGRTNLRALFLSDTRVSDAGLSNFKDCKNLTRLALSSISDAGLSNFKDCKNMRRLFLNSGRVSDAGLATFKDCKELTNLDLSETRVSDAGLAYFKDCKELLTLHLAHTPMGDAGLAPFKDCKKLAALLVEDTQVGDAGLAPFKDCKNLTQLGLHKTKVTAAGIDELKKALPRCKIEWDGGKTEVDN